MNSSDFQPGDVVVLKSGGPKMTVVEIGDFGPLGPNPGVKCEWFDEKKSHQERVFVPTGLEKY